MKTPRWYISSTLLWGLAPEKWFEIASTYGLEGLEIWTQQLISENISPERIRQLKEETGLSLTVHDYSWDLNLISLSKPMRHGAMKMIRHGIDMAARMEADQITIHPGREGLHLPNVNFDEMQAAVCVSAGLYGQKIGIPVSFEIMEKIPKERFTSAEAMKQVESYAKSPICWGYTEDLAHCDSEDEIYHIAESVSDRLFEFHVSNKQGTHRHIADARKGDFQLPEITRHLAEVYNLPMVLEGYDPSGQAEQFKSTWQWLTEE